jgi:transposase
VLAGGVELTLDQCSELRALVNASDVPASVATRARIVLWHAEHRQKKEIAELAGVSRPTVDLWLSRLTLGGIGELLDRPRGAGRERVPASVRPRILATTRQSLPVESGLSHRSSREMAAFILRTEGIYRAHRYGAKLWRDNKLGPHRQGIFKISKIQSSQRRSPTSSASTSSHLAARSCCRWTRRRRSKRWTGPSPVSSGHRVVRAGQVEPGRVGAVGRRSVVDDRSALGRQQDRPIRAADASSATRPAPGEAFSSASAGARLLIDMKGDTFGAVGL